MTCKILAQWKVLGEKMSMTICISSQALWEVDTLKELSGGEKYDSLRREEKCWGSFLYTVSFSYTDNF